MKKLFYTTIAFLSFSMATETHAQKKWSSKAKGAAVGAGAGAVTGAIINKKDRSTGGIVGGVVGGGIGYMYGRKKDKRKDEARIAAANRAAANQPTGREAVYQYPVYSNYRKASTTGQRNSTITRLNSTGSHSALGDESYEAYYNRRKSW